MINNQYLETFKIDLVKQYLNGKQKKDICKEYGIAKSAMWGWICKYSGLIEENWKVEGIKTTEQEFVDITELMKLESKIRISKITCKPQVSKIVLFVLVF